VGPCTSVHARQGLSPRRPPYNNNFISVSSIVASLSVRTGRATT